MESGSELSKTVSDVNSKDLIFWHIFSILQVKHIVSTSFLQLVQLVT